MKSLGSSKIGLVRKLNEDRFLIQEPFFIVTDGMGGHVGGEIASTIAIDEISLYINTAIKKGETINETLLVEAIGKANASIYDRILKEPALKGMGTTAVVAYVLDDSLYWASVGDSRLYVLDEGQLVQLTTDHSMVQTLVDKGEINEKERIAHPQRNLLTRAVGIDLSVNIDSGIYKIAEGNRILLCSDGLTGYVDNSQIEELLRKETKIDRVLEDLLELVYEQGAKDNVTIIVGEI